MSIKDQIMSTAVLATVEDTMKAGDFSYSAFGKTYKGEPIESIVAAVSISAKQRTAFEEYKMHRQSSNGLGR